MRLIVGSCRGGMMPARLLNRMKTKSAKINGRYGRNLLEPIMSRAIELRGKL